MNFNVEFTSRDFSTPVSTTGMTSQPISFSWSALGGAESAKIRLNGTTRVLFRALNLLRCPVLITDGQAEPVWWGYVEKITLFVGSAKFEVSLEQLFNRVKVVYSAPTADNQISQPFETDFAEHADSIAEYGRKQTVLSESALDDHFAENFRDTFLSTHALPLTVLTSTPSDGGNYAEIHCKGWYHTLEWNTYSNGGGLLANYIGPGGFTWADAANRQRLAQRIMPTASLPLKYVWVKMKRYGACNRNITCELRDNATGHIPGSTLYATSDNVWANTAIQAYNYDWVRFTFSTPYTVTAWTDYQLVFNPTVVSSTNYFLTRIDEDLHQPRAAKYYNGSSWPTVPSVTQPGTSPALIYSIIFTQDTGSQLQSIAQDGYMDQFFPRINTITTSVKTCPYRYRNYTGKVEIEKLMDLGTSNNRPILADVTPDRHLNFYEQPSPNTINYYLDAAGNIYSAAGTLIPPYKPPVGNWLGFVGADRVHLPFDKLISPACFIQNATYDVQTSRLKIN